MSDTSSTGEPTKNETREVHSGQEPSYSAINPILGLQITVLLTNDLRAHCKLLKVLQSLQAT